MSKKAYNPNARGHNTSAMNSDNNMDSTPTGVGETCGKLHEDSVNFQGDASNRKGSHGVKFRSRGSIEEIRRISRVSNYDVSEIVAYWGEGDDHALRKSELKRAVKDMYFNRRGSDNDFTTLGLDDKAGHGRAAKKVNRMLSRNAVMDEQDLQYHEGIIDDELLANVYSITSTAAKREAQDKAERLHNALVDQQK